MSKRERLNKSLRTLLGGFVLLIGLVAIPYPGPGWLIVFAGLAILAQDYPAAQRLLDYARTKYDAWRRWISRQSKLLQVLVWSMTALIVVVTIWLLNGYGILNSLFRLHLEWLNSPFMRT
jgi:uncharacterized protein (TIGR02611 family)